MKVLSSVEEMTRACASAERPLGLVPTMGALHQGHMALVRRARGENSTVAVSIFINPTQFGPHEDYAGYPRRLEQDLDLLGQGQVDLVFTPSVEEMYPAGMNTWVEVGELGRRLEGEHRPGHFRGVATVLVKLFHIIRPDRAYFGQKDGQQVVVVQRMVADLDMGIDIRVVPTVREADGLALSSRNVYLTPQQRRAAPVVYRALSQAYHMWQQGEKDADVLRREVGRVLDGEPLVEGIDYVSVADAATLEEMETIEGPAMVSVAVHMGKTRLIDNVLLDR